MSSNARDEGAPAEHEVIDVEYVPVCGKCWKAVHLTDDERWVHSE